ncbi:hypothetical protein CEXT_799351 [Caerostris extrusa]|uniref:Uncharacterized protein n=1 Tax=Caerostris extrusa TaxID=172846 RepID=A0AAV4XXH1_CAEEX|nr:hypothetical protein CEXT_799351 [Caerostris extrusa]
MKRVKATLEGLNSGDYRICLETPPTVRPEFILNIPSITQFKVSIRLCIFRTKCGVKASLLLGGICWRVKKYFWQVACLSLVAKGPGFSSLKRTLRYHLGKYVPGK